MTDKQSSEKTARPLNQYSARRLPVRGQTFRKPSLTQPDQALTPRQLLDRHHRGLSLEGGREPIYEEEDLPSDGINPATLDLVDLQEMRIQNTQKVKDLKKKGDEEAAAAREAARKAAEDAENQQYTKFKKRIEDEAQH